MSAYNGLRIIREVSRLGPHYGTHRTEKPLSPNVETHTPYTCLKRKPREKYAILDGFRLRSFAEVTYHWWPYCRSNCLESFFIHPVSTCYSGNFDTDGTVFYDV